MEADLESTTQHRESAVCVAFLREVSAFQERISTTLQPLDLTLCEFEVLQCLAVGPLRQSAISDLLNSCKASVSRCIDHLSGQAVVTPVGALIYKDRRYPVNSGSGHPNANRLRQALVDIQFGRAADRHAWLSADVTATEAPRILSPP